MQPDGRAQVEIRQFGTMTDDLLEMVEWLKGQGVTNPRLIPGAEVARADLRWGRTPQIGDLGKGLKRERSNRHFESRTAEACCYRSFESKQTGWPIGFWWSELTHPYWEFVEHGYKVDIFSPDGGNWRRTPGVILGMRASIPAMASREPTYCGSAFARSRVPIITG